MTAAAADIEVGWKLAGSGHAAISAVPIASPTPISPASFLADTGLARGRSTFERIGRWAGGAALAGSIAFIGERLWRLDWSTLQPHASWELAGAMIGAPLLFAAADRALTRAWTAVVDPEHAQPPRDMERIYAS